MDDQVYQLKKVTADTHEDLPQETPIEEFLKYLHLRSYLMSAKKIRESWNRT